MDELANQLIGTVNTPSATTQGEPNLFVKEAKDYIAEHYAENIGLLDVADAVGISSSYLSTIFTPYPHCGFADYLNQV